MYDVSVVRQRDDIGISRNLGGECNGQRITRVVVVENRQQCDDRGSLVEVDAKGVAVAFWGVVDTVDGAQVDAGDDFDRGNTGGFIRGGS